MEIYLTYNKGKSVVDERFIRTLKIKLFKHVTAISKNVYFDVLDDIVNKYNNTVHRTIKMKPIVLHLILMLSTIGCCQGSSGRYSFVCVFGKLIHSWFKPKWLQTLRPSKANVVWFSSPVKFWLLWMFSDPWFVEFSWGLLWQNILGCNYSTLQKYYKQNYNLYVLS